MNSYDFFMVSAQASQVCHNVGSSFSSCVQMCMDPSVHLIPQKAADAIIECYDTLAIVPSPACREASARFKDNSKKRVW